jgi:hypothetical protein
LEFIGGRVKALKLIVVALVSSLIAAILLAYLFRFPTIGGFVGPFGDISPYTRLNQLGVLAIISVSWLTYGLMGFFVAVAAGGIIAWIVGEATEMSTRQVFKLAAILGSLPMMYFPFAAELTPYIRSIWAF